jgi:WD40 repeat protein
VASEFRRRTVLTWAVAGAAVYGFKRAVGPSTDHEERIAREAGEAWHRHPLVAFAVSPDGTFVATGSRALNDSLSDTTEGVVLWRTGEGTAVWKRRVEGGVATEPASSALSFSPDGSLVGVLTRQNVVLSIETSGGAVVGRQPLSATEQSRRFFFSQDGTQLFVTATNAPGQLGKVLPSRTGVASGERVVSYPNRQAIPFRLDAEGLHVVDGQNYVVIPPEGAPITVAAVVPRPAYEVAVTPSRRHAGALGPDGAIGLIDVETRRTSITMSSWVNALALARESGNVFGLNRQYPVWRAYGYRLNGVDPVFSGQDVTEEQLPGTLAAAPSPDGNRAVCVDGDHYVALWEISSSRRVASLGKFEHASTVSFPLETRVVVLGPRTLVFIDLASKLPVSRYLFPEL